MAGPSLQLGVSAAGQETLVGLNAELAALRTNLAALKTGKADLSSLSGANDQLKLLRKDMANSSAGLQTAFADLAETIKGGFEKAASAQQSGGARTRSLAQQERQANQAMYDAAINAGKSFTATEIAQIRAGGVQVVEAERQVAAARAAVLAQSNRTLGEVRNSSSRLVSTAADSEISAAYAQHQKQMANEAGAAKAQAWIQADIRANDEISREHVQGFAAFAAQEKALASARRQLAAENARLETSGVRQGTTLANENNSARDLAIKRAREINEAATIEADAKAAWIRKMQAGSLAIAEAQAQADSTWMAKLQVGSAKIAAEISAAAQKEDDALQAAARRVAAAQARYTAMTSPRAQVGQQVQARAQLDQGLSLGQVQQAFGQEATAMAQLAPSLEHLKNLHAQLGSEANAATPKVAGLSKAMSDLHSAARGVASGFGAMFLTWGNLIPLLAGAGLSSAFVETLKVGAAVDQSLNQVRVLGGETAEAVAGLNTQMLEMGRNSIFGPRALAEAFRDMTLAGVTVKDQMSTIGDVVNFAVTGMTSVKAAGESLGTIGTAFGYTADGWGRVADVIAKASSISRASVEGLSKSMVTASEVHKLYGVSLVDAATNLAILSQLGIKETNAGTALKNFYTVLSGSTGKAKTAMDGWNLHFIDEGTGKFKSMLDIVKMLADKFETLKGQSQMDFVHTLSNMRGGKDMVTLVDNYLEKTGKRSDANGKTAVDPNINQLSDWRKRIDESAAYAAISMAQLSVTAQSQMEKVKSAFETALVKSFTAMEPQVLSISAKLRGIFNSDEFQGSIQRMATQVASATVFLLQHVDAIVNVVKVLLIWKAAMVVSTLLQQTVLLVTSATTALKEKAIALGLVSAAETAGAASLTASTAALTGNATAQAANAAATGGRSAATNASTAASLTAAQASAAQDVAVLAESAAERTNAIATEARAVATRQAATAASANAAATAGSTVAVEAHVIAARADAVATEAEAIAARAATTAAATQGAAMTASAVATEAATVANAANAASATRAATAGLGLISGFMRAIPVLGTILTIGALAFELFWNKASGKEQKPADSFIEKMKQVNEAIESETKRAQAHLRALNKEPEQPENLGAGEDIRKEFERRLADRSGALEKAQAELTALDAKFAAPPARAFNSQTAIRQGYSAQSSTDIAEAKRAAKERVDVIKGEIDTLKSAAGPLLSNLDSLVGAQKQVNAAADKLANAPRTPGLNDLPKEDKHAKADLSAELGLYQARYRREEADIRTHFDNMSKLNEIAHKAKEESDAEYADRAIRVATLKYEAEKANLQQFIADSQSVLAKMQALPKDKNGKGPDLKAQNTIEVQTNEARKQLEQLTFAKEHLDEVMKAKDYKLDLGLDAFIAKQDERLTKEREIAQAKAAYEFLSPNEQAMEVARVAEADKWAEKIREVNVLLQQSVVYQQKLATLNGPTDALGDQALERANEKVRFYKDQLDRLTQSQTNASQTAMTTIAVKQIPQWEKNLASWKNTTAQMASAYNEMIDGVQKAGETMWVSFMKTGKLSAQGILDVIRDTLAKKVYEESIGPMLTKLTSQFAGAIFGNQASASGNKALDISPVDIAAGRTATSLDTLSTAGITPTITVFQNLILVANQLGSALASAAGGGSGAGGLGGLFGGLFSSGQKQGTGPNSGGDYQNGSDLGFSVVDAMGAAYGGGQRYAFAKGSPFTNRTFSQPTRFSFGGGAAIGEMGEAGPEAVMPLKRGPDGSLGVAYNGGGQQSSSPVSVVVENHSGGQVKTRETKRGDGSREIRVIIDAAVDEVAGQISSGGKVGQAIESRFGVNGASGLPRR